MTDLLDTPVARLAQDLPGATAIFNQYGLSFCSGGEKLLKEAIADANIEQSQILASLAELAERLEDTGEWHQATDQELIDHLLQRFHQVHRTQLAELYRLANRVETVHQYRPHCPLGLADHLEQLSVELEQHMQKEEQILFPMLARGEGATATAPIQVMVQEHDQHTAAIARIDELTDGITPPAGACNTWRALYLGLRTFKADLEKHIQLENDILFKRNLEQ